MLHAPLVALSFGPAAIVLAVAVYVLARHTPRRRPAGTLRMLAMPVLWAGVALLIGLGPLVALMVVLGALRFVPDFLDQVLVMAATLLPAFAAPLGAVSLATARLGTPALSRLMLWMAVAGGSGMLAMLVFAMLALPSELVNWLAALAGCTCCCIAALALAPGAHLAQPRKQSPPGTCPACGYDACGLARCPECGGAMPAP